MRMAEYRVQFEVFEGPLDLLLHLVKKQEVDIYQVNLTRIATEFVTYIEQMRELDLEVAGEFVVMAATLLYIKSRELLPVDKQVVVAEEDEDEEDPRWELIRRLVEYKKFKDAAAKLQVREGEMDFLYERRPMRPELPSEEPARRGALSVFDLVNAVATILKRYNERTDVREIQADPFTVSEKIDYLRHLVSGTPRFRFSELFDAARTRAEVVVTFLALLELIRMKLLIATQGEQFGEIEIEIAPGPQPAPTIPEEGKEPDAETPAKSESIPYSTPPVDFIAPIIPPPPDVLHDALPLANDSNRSETA
jgi:segregation and condensation protein A